MNSINGFFWALIFALGFPPVGWWPLTLVSCIAVSLHSLKILRESRFPRKELFVFHLSWRVGLEIFGFYWLAYTLKEFGGLPWAAAVPTALLIFLGGSLLWAGLWSAGFTFLWKKWLKKIPIWRAAVALGLFWILADCVDLRFFPWIIPMGMGSDEKILPSVYLLGDLGWRVLFFGFVAAWTSLWLGTVAHKRSWYFGLCLSFLALVFGLGLISKRILQKRHPEIQPVALLQGNVGNYEKKLTKMGVMPTIENVLRIHQNLVEQGAIWMSDVAAQREPWFFWPETSFPGRPVENSRDRTIMENWTRLTRGLHVVGAYEFGSAEFAGQQTKLDYNVAVLFHEATGLMARYRKVRRVAFGEYIPGDEWFPKVYDWMPSVPHFGKGQGPELLAHPDPSGPVFIPLICYEILHKDLVNDSLRAAAEKFPGRPIILVNPTNDSWYGPTSEPFQHSLLARWNSARVGLAMLRPTNTGLSQIIAPWGEVLAQGPRDEVQLITGWLPVEKAQARIVR